MTASVTNSFREHLLTLLKSDIDSDGVPYHIGIAQPDSDAFYSPQLRFNV